MPPVGLTRCLGGQAPWKRLRYKTKFPGFRGIFAASGHRTGCMPQGKESMAVRAPDRLYAAGQREERLRRHAAQDCSPALSGVGLPAPEQEGAQRIPTGDRNGCSVTLPGHRTGGTPQKTTIGGYDEQGNGAIAL